MTWCGAELLQVVVGLAWGWMGLCGWGGGNGEWFERGGNEVGGGFGTEERLVWKMAGGCALLLLGGRWVGGLGMSGLGDLLGAG